MRAFFIATLCISAVVCQIPIPASVLEGVTNAGVPTLSTEIQNVNKAFVQAIGEFQAVNASCNTIVKSSIEKCKTCVQRKCKARVESVCKPEQWQVILGKTIGFFTTGIPDFFTKQIPDVVVNGIGGKVIDITKSVGGIATDIGDKIVGAGKTVAGGVVDAGKGIIDFGNGIKDGILDVGGKIKDFGVKIGDGVNTAIDGIKDIGGKIKDVFSNIFGKRTLLERIKRASEPSCSDFEKKEGEACKFYFSQTYCPDCAFNPDQVCPGYKAARDKVTAANNARAWLNKVTDQVYEVVEMTYDPTKIDATGNFAGVKAKVKIFGKEFSFTLASALNPYISTLAGPVVAKQALQLFKSS